jgi:hypothetical protein
MLIIRLGVFFELRGILLSLLGDTIRVALEDCGDAAEFRRVGDRWIAESGEAVEIEWRPLPSPESFRVPLVSTERPTAHHCLV